MPTALCPICALPAPRKPTGPTTSVYETLDNGLQAKATVRPADAERMFKEIEIAADAAAPQAPDEADLENIDYQGELL